MFYCIRKYTELENISAGKIRANVEGLATACWGRFIEDDVMITINATVRVDNTIIRYCDMKLEVLALRNEVQ